MDKLAKERQDIFYKDLGHELKIMIRKSQLEDTIMKNSPKLPVDMKVFSQRTISNYITGFTKPSLFNLIELLKLYRNETPFEFRHGSDLYQLSKVEQGDQPIRWQQIFSDEVDKIFETNNLLEGTH